MTASLTPAALADALAGARLVGALTEHDEPAIRDITHDSRAVGPGVMFAARPGVAHDGHDFAPVAVADGAPALLVERHLPGLDVPQVIVGSVGQALGPAADLVHGRPTADIQVLGVTGTNGKTTTAYLLDAIWRAAGRSTGLIGTVETRIGDTAVPGVRTTPEATDLHRLFAQMRDVGVTAASIEVSSHGLSLGRLGGVRFAAALFTNLSQDHLDFHGDMESYFQAKALLFTPTFTPIGVITVDQPSGERMAAAATSEVWTLARTKAADVTATDVVTDPDGATFLARVHRRRIGVRINLPGDFNVTNALGAIATAHAAGVDLDTAAEGLAALPGVPGRMERVDVGQPFGVIVDYAHTPDSVASVLASARQVTTGTLIVVLGCGGDRDKRKRPLMARAAVTAADRAVFTSDNPRTEDPEQIIDDMVSGLANPSAAIRIPDRRSAIAEAIGMAEPGDVVVIAGKGHEPYQDLAEGRIDFDDRLVARDLLTRRFDT